MSGVFKLVAAVGLFIFLPVLPVALSAGNDSLFAVPVLKRVVINGDSAVSFDDDDAQDVNLTANSITLSAKSGNILFELEPVEGAYYSFYLDGFDKTWTERRKSNYKEYTNLPAGKYKFYASIDDAGSGQCGEAMLIEVIRLQEWYLTTPAIISLLAFVLFMLWAFYRRLSVIFARKRRLLEQTINARTEELNVEKEKSEALVANLFPKNTAGELTAKGAATKVKYNFVTVMFSDIQGFTRIAEEMNPEYLIYELDKFLALSRISFG